MSARELLIEAWKLRHPRMNAAVEVDGLLGLLSIAGLAIIPTQPTDEMVRAAAESKASDDEGEFRPLCDLIDFSGENKTRTVIRAALTAAILAASSPRPPIGENK